MKYYIADLHFHHKSLLERMDHRHFDSVEKMNQYMIDRWNSRVKDNDEVIILGDFSLGNGEKTSETLKNLKGKKSLITGNHDFRYLDDPNFNLRAFQWVRPYAEIRDGKRFVCLSHYPMMCYNGQYKRNQDKVPTTFMLYGHTHCTMDELLIRNYQIKVMSMNKESGVGKNAENIPCNMINCFCMFSDYTPLTLDEWIDIRNSQLIIQNQLNEKISVLNKH